MQCVNAKAMSWLSMVEYRDLCKLFFKLKIKNWYYTNCKVLGDDKIHTHTHIYIQIDCSAETAAEVQ